MREQVSQLTGTSPPPSPWALFIVEVERGVFSLFHWWGEILQASFQNFTISSWKTAIRSLYL
jgi:hypothetical protein